jgi:hypothetical protein
LLVPARAKEAVAERPTSPWRCVNVRALSIPFAIGASGLFLVPTAAEQTPSVDQICEAAWMRAHASPDKAKIFVSIQTPRAPGENELQGDWRAVATHADLETLVSQTAYSGLIALYDEAFVWELPGNSLVITMFHASSTGDWAHYVDYCFRANGSLASVESTLATFYAAAGPVRRIRKRRFDARGKQLWVLTRVVDARSGRTMRDAQFRDQDEEIFATRAALPFSRLLGSAR